MGFVFVCVIDIEFCVLIHSLGHQDIFAYIHNEDIMLRFHILEYENLSFLAPFFMKILPGIFSLTIFFWLKFYTLAP